MRGTAVAVMLGCTFGAIGSGVGQQHDIADVRLTAAIRAVSSRTAAKTTRVAAQTMKTVEYRGYAIRVPASWPVYMLSKDPSQCVRYDVNAVYLGTPGPDQKCPAHLVGRADTVSIGGPATPGPRSTPVQTDLRAAVGANRAGPNTPAPPGTIMQDPQLGQFSVAMPGHAPGITATYGNNPAQVIQVLAGVHQITQQSAQTGTTANPIQKPVGVTATSDPSPTDGPSASDPPGDPAPPSWIPPSWPTPTPTGSVSPTPPANPARPPSPPPAPPGAQLGFDTCGAPALKTMQAWRAKYTVAAVYIGGQEMGCGYGNLSKSWVQSAEAMGWSLMPVFVGLQAPCNSFSREINPSQAAAQGKQAATQAVSDAASFGLGPGSPIYFDMEAYNEKKASCVTAVLTFLDSWDRQLQASGYVSGVYSSVESGVVNLQTTTSIAGHPLTKPQAIWFALWNNVADLTGSPYMTPAVWPPAARSKQYAGPRVVKVGGISLDIDSDLVDSPVAHG
jgi:Domain of unknown function (DUF1906)